VAYADVVQALSPVGYWRLGESSGTTATDSSGNGYDGAYVSGFTLGVTGLLTGDADTALTPGDSAFAITLTTGFTNDNCWETGNYLKQFTIGMLIDIPSAPGIFHYLFGDGAIVGTINPDRTVSLYHNGGSWVAVTTTGTVPLNTTTLITVSYDGNVTTKISINGTTETLTWGSRLSHGTGYVMYFANSAHYTALSPAGATIDEIFWLGTPIAQADIDELYDVAINGAPADEADFSISGVATCAWEPIIPPECDFVIVSSSAVAFEPAIIDEGYFRILPTSGMMFLSAHFDADVNISGTSATSFISPDTQDRDFTIACGTEVRAYLLPINIEVTATITAESAVTFYPPDYHDRDFVGTGYSFFTPQIGSMESGAFSTPQANWFDTPVQFYAEAFADTEFFVEWNDAQVSFIPEVTSGNLFSITCGSTVTPALARTFDTDFTATSTSVLTAHFVTDFDAEFASAGAGMMLFRSESPDEMEFAIVARSRFAAAGFSAACGSCVYQYCTQ